MKDLISRDSDLIGIKHCVGEILNIYEYLFEYFDIFL